MDPIVSARSVRKAYRSTSAAVEALRDVDLDIGHGEMVAVVGPSGCGKTTLLNCLSGLDGIDAGEVVVGGETIHRLPERRRTTHRGRRMGFIFQFFNLIPVLSAVENVELPLLMNGTRSTSARRRAKEMLALVGIDSRGSHRPAELSGGQQQRVAIARALVNEPEIVWADEPTGNLDSETSGEVMDLLVRLNREEARTFVLVTHDAAVSAHAHRVIRMRDGRIEPAPDPDAVLVEST
jgi:putative ABC transport system ATP-binding protein